MSDTLTPSTEEPAPQANGTAVPATVAEAAPEATPAPTEEPLPDYLNDLLEDFDSWDDVDEEIKSAAVAVDLTPLDPQKENEGAWFEVKKHRVTKRLICEPWTEDSDEDATAVKLGHYGNDLHAKYVQKLQESLTQLFGPNYDLDDPNSVQKHLQKHIPVKRKQFAIKQLQPLWKDSRNLIDHTGKSYEFSEKTQIIFLSQEEFASAVLQACIRRDPFQKEVFAANLTDSAPGESGH